jgi:hypothetical protein
LFYELVAQIAEEVPDAVGFAKANAK